MPTDTIASRLKSLGIELPPVASPAAAYVMAVTSGSTVFVSGHIAKQGGRPWVGKLGLDMDTASGKVAARSIAIDLMATLQAHLGSLDRVKRIVKVMGLVNSTDIFTEHHLVVNGCSELLFEVFGEAGKHARSAFGVVQIPLGACVEIELIAEIE
jgi:enamine deaminase RidA (YjgF/YER057c/UK114 family)